MYIVRFLKLIFDNTDIIEMLINLAEILAFCVSSSMVVIKAFTSCRKKFLLKKINVSKAEYQNLKLYIDTYGQEVSPIDEKESNKSVLHFKLINFFIDDVFKKDKFGRYFIILAESGMGKTTFLRMLYLRYKRKILKNKKILFYPLTNYFNLEKISKVENKQDYIILLDSLDEDEYALGDYKKRINEIINVTQEFYKVIITCRTQFFSDESSEPKDISLRRYGSISKKQEFHKIYISIFSNENIKKFLKKKYKWKKQKIKKAKEIINKSPDLMVIPMLLTYIDSLLDNNEKYFFTVDIYKVIIKKWIEWEAECEILSSFINSVVLYMFKNNVQFLKANDIAGLCEKEIKVLNPVLARTRSLLVRNGSGEYKFTHKSIFEYLISYEAVCVDENLREKLLKMGKAFNKLFFRELSYNQLMSGDKNLKFLDFFQLSLKSHGFENVNFYGANLEEVSFRNACFRNANLNKTNLKKADLCIANLEKASLLESRLVDAKLIKANLSDARLEKAILAGAILVGADLEKADLEDANLRRAVLTDANLKKANFSKADLSDARLENTNMTGSILMGANLKNTNLNNADLNGANLENVDLKETILTSVNLKNTNLKGADLSGANLENADLEGVILTGVKLRNTNLKGADLSDSNLENADLEETILTGAKLKRANLKNANLKKANLEKANLEKANLYNVYFQQTLIKDACINDIIIDEYNKKYIEKFN